MAKLKNLNNRQTTLLHSVNWLENTFDGHCYVMDVNFDSGAMQLFGKDSGEFRRQVKAMMKGVYNG
jgi:hypothetical protein